MSSRKIFDIKEKGKHLICIKTDDKYNPYRLYNVYWEDGSQHRMLLNKYCDFNSILYYIYKTF